MALSVNEIKTRQRAGTYRADRHGPSKIDTPLGLKKPKHGERLKDTKPPWPLTKADELALENGCWFDIRFAEYVRDWAAKYLKLWEGEWHGQEFELMPWQWEHVIGPLFGWFRWDDERKRPVRRFDRCYIEVAKKNGKSPLAALVGCYLLAGDNEQGNAVYSTATKRDQANIVHRHATNMVDASPELECRVKPNRSTHLLTYLPTNSIYRALSSDASGSEGLNGSIIIDELHAWPGRSFFDTLRYAGASRAEPINFAITTAGDDMQSVCREQHEYAQGVLSGAIKDDGFLGYICAADEKDDPGSPETWAKANPSLGKTVFSREMEAAYKEAKDRPAKLNAFRRYRLNQWVATEAQWLLPERWSRCAGKFELCDLDKDINAGMDLSRTRDLTSFVMTGKVDGVYSLVPYFWITEAWLKNLKKAFPQMSKWAAQGLVSVIPGEIIDYEVVFNELDDIVSVVKPTGLYHDRRFASDAVSRFCEKHGIECVDCPQTETFYTAPIQEFERRVLTQKLQHPDNELLNWQVSHCLIEESKRGIMLAKRRTGDFRTIDGVVASVMGLSHIVRYEPDRPSVYRERGVMQI